MRIHSVEFTVLKHALSPRYGDAQAPQRGSRELGKGVHLVTLGATNVVAVEGEGGLALVEDLCNTMKLGSLCALGGFTPYPVMSALKHFREDFGQLPARMQAAE